jgi:hypothetical protein
MGLECNDSKCELGHSADPGPIQDCRAKFYSFGFEDVSSDSSCFLADLENQALNKPLHCAVSALWMSFYIKYETNKLEQTIKQTSLNKPLHCAVSALWMSFYFK